MPHIVARVVTQHFIKLMARDENCLLSSQKGENCQKGRCYQIIEVQQIVPQSITQGQGIITETFSASHHNLHARAPDHICDFIHVRVTSADVESDPILRDVGE